MQHLAPGHAFAPTRERATDEERSISTKLARAGVLVFAALMLATGMGLRARLVTMGTADRDAPQEQVPVPASDDAVMPVADQEDETDERVVAAKIAAKISLLQ